jgi:hypothetical protein
MCHTFVDYRQVDSLADYLIDTDRRDLQSGDVHAKTLRERVDPCPFWKESSSLCRRRSRHRAEDDGDYGDKGENGAAHTNASASHSVALS